MAYKYIEPKEKVYAKAYKVFRGTPSATVDIKTNYPTVDYTKLTNDDFITSYVSDGNWSHDDKAVSRDSTYSIQALSFYTTHSYNASTGILTIGKSTSNSLVRNTPDTSYENFSGLVCEAVMIVDGVREEYT